MPRPLLLLLLLLIVTPACRGHRDDDDTTPDDDDTTPDDDDDDDSGDDDDSTAGDDDDSTAGDDDDSTTAANAPVIVSIEACETQLIGNAYIGFEIELDDPDGDLLNPVRYFQTWENIDNGDLGPLTQFTIEADMGSGGTFSHLVPIGQAGISRNRQYEFEFYVLDSAGNQSNVVLVPYFVWPAAGQDPC